MKSLFSFIFGDDIFISYSRKDGSAYATSLANALSSKEKDYKVFFDRHGTQPGIELPPEVLKKLHACKMFVLIGSEEALKSKFVQQEVEHFIEKKHKTGRGIFRCIDFGGWPETRWVLERNYQTMAYEIEGTSNAENGKPSEKVMDFIHNSFSYKKSSERQFAIAITLVTLMCIAITLGLFYGKKARDSRKETTQAIKDKIASEISLKRNISELDSINGEYHRSQDKLAATNTSLGLVKSDLESKKTEAKELDLIVKNKNQAASMFYQGVQILNTYDNILNSTFDPFVYKKVMPQLISVSNLDSENVYASTLLNQLINKAVPITSRLNIGNQIKQIELGFTPRFGNQLISILTEAGTVSLLNTYTKDLVKIDGLSGVAKCTVDPAGSKIAYIKKGGNSRSESNMLSIDSIHYTRTFDERINTYSTRPKVTASPWIKLEHEFESPVKVSFDETGNNLLLLDRSQKFHIYNTELKKSTFVFDSVVDYVHHGSYLLLAVGDLQISLVLLQKQDSDKTCDYQIRDTFKTTDRLWVRGFDVSEIGEVIWIEDRKEIPDIAVILHSYRRNGLHQSLRFENTCSMHMPKYIGAGFSFVNMCQGKTTMHFFKSGGFNQLPSEVCRLMPLNNIVGYAKPDFSRQLFVAAGSSIYLYDLNRFFEEKDIDYSIEETKNLMKYSLPNQ